jgi:hypothetical protein
MLACGATLAAAEDPTPFVLDSVESKFAADVAKAKAEVTKAEAELVKATKAAAASRLKAYKDRLVEVTKTGDFDKAQAVKARIAVLEADPETEKLPKTKRPRPKDAVKFGGHTYAVIREKLTWHTAKLRCEDMGGHLIVLDSDKETAFAIELARSNNVAAWLGASNDENAAEWKWVTGKPANTKGWTLNDEDRQHFAKAVLWWPESNSINDHDLGARSPCICEWE